MLKLLENLLEAFHLILLLFFVERREGVAEWTEAAEALLRLLPILLIIARPACSIINATLLDVAQRLVSLIGLRENFGCII